MSSTDKFLTFVFNHQLTIIEALFVLILVIAIAWLVINLREENQASADGPGLKDIEETLKRVLEEIKPPQPSPASLQIKDEDETAAVASAGSSEELAKLQAELKSKSDAMGSLEKSLAELRTQLASAQSKPADAAGASTEDIAALKRKLSEVEEKLGEYEIIEDDIANLSLYKEENTRLKNEIQKLRAGGSVAEATPSEKPPAAPSAVEAPAAVVPPTAPASEVMPEAVTAVGSASEGVGPLSKEVNPDKLLDEFDALVKKQGEAPKGPEGEKPDSGQALIAEFEAFMKGGG